MQQPKPFDDADLYDCAHLAAEAALYELRQRQMAAIEASRKCKGDGHQHADNQEHKSCDACFHICDSKSCRDCTSPHRGTCGGCIHGKS
jgi:hypothetical protein